MPQIVTVNVTQTIAPTPSKLQKTGVLISQGATITSPGTLSLLTQLADLTPILSGSHALASLSWSGGFVTAAAAAPHGFDIGDEFELTIAGATPTGYNGTYLVTVTSTTAFTYYKASNPGAATVMGAYTEADVAQLTAMATTFFSQGSSVAVYVMELGAGSVEDGVAFLTQYLIDNPGEIYSFLTPREWDGNAAFLSLIASFESTTAKTYFWVTTTVQNHTKYTDLMKDTFTLVEAPQQHIFQQNEITAIDYDGDSIAISAAPAVSQSGAGSYAPADVLTATGITGDAPTFTVVDTQLTAATIASAGTGGTPGAVVLTGTTGTGTKFQIAGTIDGTGALTALGAITVAGAYTVNPIDLANEPVTGGSLAGAELNIKMGVKTVTVLDPGSVETIPDNPLATTVAPAGGTGATLNVDWQVISQYGTVTITTTTDHGVNVGDMFQLAGFTPTGYNTYYTALPGTAGDTLVAYLNTNPGVATVLGTLVASRTEAEGLPATEFSLAAPFWNALHYDPSSTNKVAPFAFQYVFGVTPWPQKGNNALLQTLKNNATNYLLTGAEGGISDVAIFWGVTGDDRDFTYWYSVDWMQITSAQNLANVVINGSNNPINPLYYDQNGIDRLQDSVVATLQTAVAVGLANGVPTRAKMKAPEFIDALENGEFDGKLVVNAIPFLDYLRDNPNDYQLGRYAGLSVQYIPNRGFISIVFNINVTDFIVA